MLADILEARPATPAVAHFFTCGSAQYAVQNLNMKLLEERFSIRDLPRYARRAAKRQRVNTSRKTARDRCRLIPIDIISDLPAADQSPLSTLLHHEEHEQIRRAITQLSPQQHRAIRRSLSNVNSPADSTMIEPKTTRAAHNSARYKAIQHLRRMLGAQL